MIEWKKWGATTIENTHGPLETYRDIYDGHHEKHFQRAKDLIEKGEITSNLIHGRGNGKHVQTPYIIANVSKLVPEIPAMLVSRSIGDVVSSLKATEDQNDGADEAGDMIEGLEDSHQANREIHDLQQEMINQISKNSKLRMQHWTNLIQHQVDGALVGVPFHDDMGLRIDFKQRDVYYPHPDNRGCDLAYQREIEGKEYLHVYRERVEKDGLRTSNHLYQMEEESGGELQEVDPEDAKELLGIDELERFYEGRQRPFVVYWANEATFRNPLGSSSLRNQESKQDEINWTLTRNGITFERNGKPRISVSTAIMNSLKDIAAEKHGDENRIDHRDLEITEIDEQGNSIQIHQIDVEKIGDIQWVKDLMKLMFVETRTSEKAVDFYLDAGATSGTGAVSGVAKFYDLFVSITKAEGIQGEYAYFLSQLFENCLWLAAEQDTNIIIEEPDITLKSMVPISRKELIEENKEAHKGEIQSREKSVRNINPGASEEFVAMELARIEAEKSGDDTASLLRGRANLEQFLDNPSTRPPAEETDPPEGD